MPFLEWIMSRGGQPPVISHKCRLFSWLFLAIRPPIHFLHKTFPCTIVLTTRFLTVPSFTALAVLFTDCQNLTYVKQQNEALPFWGVKIYKGLVNILLLKNKQYYLAWHCQPKVKWLSSNWASLQHGDSLRYLSMLYFSLLFVSKILVWLLVYFRLRQDVQNFKIK